MISTVVGFAVVGGLWAALTVVVLVRVARDYSTGEVTTPTAILLWPWHGLNYAVLILIGALGIWSFELPFAVPLGIALVIAGVAVIAAGFYEFSTVQRLSGTQTDEVIDSGIYRFSRHPQYLGVISTLIGIAVIGESWLALLFAVSLSVGFVTYLPTEERYAERSLGDSYRDYRRRTPLLLGRPRAHDGD